MSTEVTMDSGDLSPQPPPSEIRHPHIRYWTWGLGLFALLWLAAVVFAFPEPLELARRQWPLVLIGVAGAVIGNATAIGGGLVFIPVMVIFYQFSPVEALMIAIANQAFGMTSGAIAWLRRGEVPLARLPTIVPPMLAGCLVATFVVQPSGLLIKGLFGPVSVLIGVVTLTLLNHSSRREDIPEDARWGLIAASFVGGLLTGWVAIGIGEILAAFLILRYGLRPERSIGLGVLLLSISSIFLLTIYGFQGQIPWEYAAFMILGCVFGARLGPFVCQWVSARTLKIGFATVAIGDGLLFIYQYLASPG